MHLNYKHKFKVLLSRKSNRWGCCRVVLLVILTPPWYLLSLLCPLERHPSHTPLVPSSIDVFSLLRQEAVKGLKQLDLLSYTAVNNAIRVTDCQEGAE